MEGAEAAEPLLTCTGDTPLDAYHVTADPVSPGVSGVRFFGTNVDLVIYEHTETFAARCPTAERRRSDRKFGRAIR